MTWPIRHLCLPFLPDDVFDTSFVAVVFADIVAVVFVVDIRVVGTVGVLVTIF